jgi:hypothetical protein
MISTVTTSTISTVTSAAMAGSLALISILILLALLIQKEVALSAESSRFQRLNRMINFGIAPLLIAFILVVAVKVYEVLR